MTPSDFALYLQNGLVDVGKVVVIVECLMFVLKPIIDALGSDANPNWTKSQAHDSLIQLLLVAMTIVLSLIFQAVSPIGLHGGQQIVTLVVQAALAIFTELGVYSAIRGPVPVTPNENFLNHLKMQSGYARHLGLIYPAQPAPEANEISRSEPPLTP